MKRIFCAVLVLLLLAGCKAPWETKHEDWLLGEGNGQEATVVQQQISKETLVQALELMMLENAGEDTTRYLEELHEQRKFQVTGYTQEEQTITAQVSVTVPDMYAAAKVIESEIFSTGDEADAAMCQAMKTVPIRNVTLEVTLVAQGATWQVVVSEALLDACYGGLLTYQREYMQEVA